jgi:lysophospholipase L1-like esterase
LVKVLRCTENNAGPIFVDDIKTDGEFLPHGIADKKLRIEVLGDSISCGFGNLWNGEELTDGFGMYEDATQTFATMLADRFDADYRVEAISGVGLSRNIGGPKGSGGACGLFLRCNTGETVEKDWFWNPDVLIIELGTNDRDSEDYEMKEAVAKMLRIAREGYPDAYIIWYNGLMDVKHNPNILAAVKEMNDPKIALLETKTMESLGERIGLWGHPTVEAHKRAADELEKIIIELTGLKTVK